jgi:hypothetical protein
MRFLAAEAKICDRWSDHMSTPSQQESQSQPLTKYDAACRAVAEAKSVDEAKHIHDAAAAMEFIARQAKNKDLEADAKAIRMRALRKLDELRRKQKATVGLNKGGGDQKSDHRVSGKPGDLPTLASQGIDKNMAHNSRVFGKMSEETFEEAVEHARREKTAPKKRRAKAPHRLASDDLKLNLSKSTVSGKTQSPNEIIEQAIEQLDGKRELLLQVHATLADAYAAVPVTSSDDESPSRRALQAYLDADDAARRAIDEMLTILCGRPLPTMALAALKYQDKSEHDDDFEEEQDPILACIDEATAELDAAKEAAE